MSQQRPVRTDAFIIGLVVGLLVGGSALALLLFVLFGVALDGVTKNPSLAFILEYVVAILIGLGAAWAVRKNVGFMSGLLVGLSAGLLGGTAFCNVLVGGLNNMH